MEMNYIKLLKMEKNQNKLCEICDSIATNICMNCPSYFCDTCYKLYHEKKEINNKHKKEKIDHIVQIDTKCSVHPKYPMEIFCVDEKGMNYLFNFYFLYLL